MVVYVAVAVHGPDTAIVGVFSEEGLAMAAARARCRDEYQGESVPLVLPFGLDVFETPWGSGHLSSPAARGR